MEWFEAIVSALGGSILTLVSAIVYFRQSLKGDKAKTEAIIA